MACPSISTFWIPGGRVEPSWAMSPGAAKEKVEKRIATMATNRAFSTSTPPAHDEFGAGQAAPAVPK
jgi:hypothetical protein